MTKNVQLYSDCDFFAGCENMISVIMNNRDKFTEADIHFFYRQNKLYTSGLASRLSSSENVHPLKLLNLSGFFLGNNDPVRKNLRRIMHLIRLLLLPLIIVQNFYVLYRHFRATRPDVLLLNNGGYPGAMSTRIAAVVANFVGVNSICMVVNNTAIPYTSFFRRIGLKFDQKVAQSVDLFITGSEPAGLALEQVLGVRGHQRRVFHNCIERKRFEALLDHKPKNDKVVFANIALLERRKGHIVLFQAVLNLIRRRPELRDSFLINVDGVGREQETLYHFIQEHNLGDIIVFLGATANIGTVYRDCDVFVLPSISNEDLPNVISEALLFGKPVIASKIAGIPHQVIDGLNGYLVEPGSVEQLSFAIENCIDNREHLEFMGAKSKEIFEEKFSVEAALANYIEIFHKGVQS